MKDIVYIVGLVMPRRISRARNVGIEDERMDENRDIRRGRYIAKLACLQS